MLRVGFQVASVEVSLGPLSSSLEALCGGGLGAGDQERWSSTCARGLLTVTGPGELGTTSSFR